LSDLVVLPTRFAIGTAVIGALLALAVLGPGMAIADGPRTPYVVARGKSLYGVPWRIRMGEEPSYGKGLPRYANLYFSLGRPSEENEAGLYSSFPLPISRAFTFHATSGSDIDAFPESDSCGVASRRTAKLVATMSEGPPLTFETQLAPTSLSNRFHWLRRLRFFDQFYPAGIEPTEISAYDQAGQLLDRQPA
jgi:hypothetical protein